MSTATAMIFVGERRSATARLRGWTWRDGRLAALPLFEALRALGLDPGAHDYVNLWTDSGSPVVPWQRVAMIRARRLAGVVVVALGKRVSGELARRGVEHVSLVHPAARGKIRERSRYVAHVRERLAPHLASSCRAPSRGLVAAESRS